MKITVQEAEQILLEFLNNKRPCVYALFCEPSAPDRMLICRLKVRVIRLFSDSAGSVKGTLMAESLNGHYDIDINEKVEARHVYISYEDAMIGAGVPYDKIDYLGQEPEH